MPRNFNHGCIVGHSDTLQNLSLRRKFRDLANAIYDPFLPNTPIFEATEIEVVLAAAKERYRVLYCLLAGSGLRISKLWASK